MAAFVFTGHLLPGGIEALLPSRGALDVDQDVDAHELQDSQDRNRPLNGLLLFHPSV
jgi:hypothetical protein